MPAHKGGIDEKVREIATRICEESGLELFDIEFRSDERSGLLRILIDSENGVSIGDCTKVSREISTQLDVSDLIRSRYRLEVGSPGLDRPLRNLEDAARAVGKRVKVKAQPIDNQKKFIGILQAVEDQSLVIEDQGKRFMVPWSKVRKAKIVYEF